MNIKNIAKGTTESFKVDDGIILLKQSNVSELKLNYNKYV